MTSKRKLYREDEKLFFLHSYYQSGMSKHAFCRAHGICCPALLNSWIKKYSNLAEELSLPSEQESPDMSNRSKEAYKDENAQLKKRIKELEKALSFSKLETEARELMITRAEELFNIPIRKNLGLNRNGTGQSAQPESCVGLPSVWPLSSSLLPVKG
ncbi:transposase [Bacteroides uniformis]|nr:transposase [Bacteroides uniformis]